MSIDLQTEAPVRTGRWDTAAFRGVWTRELTLFRRLWPATTVSSIAEPTIYLLAFGFGFGALVSEINGIPYVEFLATGTVAVAVLFSSVFAGMFTTYVRRVYQRTYDAVLATQKSVLDHLMNPVVLKRITDTELYGNSYTLSEMMGDLSEAIFADDARDDVNTFRQNLQMEYVNRLAGMVRGDGRKAYHTPAQSLALYQLTNIQDLLEKRRGGNTATQAHTQHLLLTIERALSDDV